MDSLFPPENPPPEPGLLLPEDGPHGPSRAKILNLFFEHDTLYVVFNR